MQLACIQMTRNKMFPFDVSMVGHVNTAAVVQQESVLWHLQFEHLNIRGLKLLHQKNMVKGLPSIDQIDVYEGCVYGKQTRRAFPTNRAWRASKALALIYADICGPMETRSLGGNRYFLLFRDDHTLMSWVYFLNYKSQALEHFQKFKALVEEQNGLPIKHLHNDKGGNSFQMNSKHSVKIMAFIES